MIHENDNYEVVVGMSSGEEYDGELYHVKNKSTGVTEVETRILPQAIMFCDQLNTAIEEGNTSNIPKIDYSH